jgi:uncharacterized protein YuzE
MKIEYDKEVDALYIRIQDEYVARTQEVSEGVNLDFDDQDRLIGLDRRFASVQCLGSSRGAMSPDYPISLVSAYL